MLNTLREICAVLVEDGIEFDVAALRVDQIREELENGAVRIRTIATVGGARANVVIDVGFGDAIEPGNEERNSPSCSTCPRRA
jgi:nucleotidyltransferase AbiEii toxin of type IV toxin-antitoxin system